MKPYIISAFNNGIEASRYWLSLDVALGDRVQPITLIYQNNGKHDECFIPGYARVIKAGKEYSGNTGRHKDLFSIVRLLKLDPDAWCIFTDVHDVIFQNRLPDFPVDADILVCDEGKKFGEIGFWRSLMPERMLNLQSYNSGVWAMRYSVLLEYWEYLYAEWMKFYEWHKNAVIPRLSDKDIYPFDAPMLNDYIKNHVAIVYNSTLDTIAFIDFLATTKHKIKVVPELFACYAFQYELGQIKEKDEQMYLANGKIPAIVHYNGDSKIFLKKAFLKNAAEYFKKGKK